MPLKYIDYVKAYKRIAPFALRIIARTLVEVDKRMEHQKRFIKRMEDAKTSSIQRFETLPKNMTIRKEYVKCGKNSCEMPHGLYYYAYWKERV